MTSSGNQTPGLWSEFQCLIHLATCFWVYSVSSILYTYALHKKATKHQVTTTLATSKNVLFPGHNHQLTTRTDDCSLTGARAIISVGSSVPVVSRWLWPGNRTFLEVASMVLSGFFAQWCLLTEIYDWNVVLEGLKKICIWLPSNSHDNRCTKSSSYYLALKVLVATIDA